MTLPSVEIVATIAGLIGTAIAAGLGAARAETKRQRGAIASSARGRFRWGLRGDVSVLGGCD